jgi:hypothetical protein
MNHPLPTSHFESSRFLKSPSSCSSSRTLVRPSYATMTVDSILELEIYMARRLKDIKEIKIERPQRAKLSAKEVIKRMEEFPKRREQFIATVRKRKN